MVKKTRNFLVLITLFLYLSCNSLYTNKSHYDNIDYFLENGETYSALESLQSAKDYSYGAKDRVLYYLEEGMLLRYAGEYEKSNEALTKAEYAIEDLLTNSISKGILSGVLNDNALDYSGEDYEDLYINLFKSLNYLQLNQNENALVEIRRLNNKLNNLEDKYRDELRLLNDTEDASIPESDYYFYNDAMARYLGILAYRMDNSIDDARIERDYFTKSFIEQPHIYTFPTPSLPEISNNKTLVNILSFTGLSPEKYAETININTGSGSIYLDSGSSNRSSYIGFNTIGYRNMRNNISLKLQFPMLVSNYDPVSYIEVFIDGAYYGTLEAIESIDNVALETFKVKQPLIIGKTVIRAVSKAILSEISETAVTNKYGEGFGLLTGLAGSIYMQVSENSDLRISRYFPSMISGIEIEIDPGVHDFILIYYDRHSNIIFQEDINNKDIKHGSLNLIESHLMRKL